MIFKRVTSIATTRLVARGIVVEAEAVVAKTTGLRKVGTALESVDDVFSNPNLLKGQTPLQVKGTLGSRPGWQVEALGKGSHKGQGLILREYGQKDQLIE